jgi:polyferredoxin
MKPWMIGAVIVLVAAMVFTGCFPGGETYKEKEPAGFFSGIWHGWIAPISLIVGFFDNNIRIYEVRNTGWWYDLGFYMAVISGFGGLALSRKKKKNGQ